MGNNISKCETYVNKFILKVKDKYPDIIIEYNYNEDRIFDIRHNNRALQFGDKEFSNYIGALIRDMFFNNNIFNISFGYDYNYDRLNDTEEEI